MPAEPRRRAGLRRRRGSAAPDRRRFGLRRRGRRIVLAALAAIGVVVLGLGALVVYAALTLPDINDIGQVTGTIRILDRNGNLIESVGHESISQQSVPLSQIAPIMQNAMLAAEDRNFYSEGAFDFPRVIKAVIDDIILRSPAEGASTITQQLVKQAFFGEEASKDPLRKIREALLAQEIDSKWSKQQILDAYLNVTYFGENAYGVQSAAERYFGKSASALTLPEAALIAGLPQAPSADDPYNSPQNAFTRMHYVLGGLVSMGVITQAQADAVDPLTGGDTPTAAQKAAALRNQQAVEADLQNGQPNAIAGPAPFFVEQVESDLQHELANDPAYLDGNLTVTTTLDLGLQEKADQDVAEGVARLGHGANNGALLMLDPSDGDILAMVGSADYSDSSIAGDYNVVMADRQPGSSFKPFVYETGFKEGALTPGTVLQDTYAESRRLGGVQDFDREYEGAITATQALLGSRNIATEQAMQIAGVQNVINFATSAGITTPIAPNLSSAIGTSATSMMDLATGYAAFANGGTRVTPRDILKVADGSGTVIIDNTQPPGGTRIMTPAQAWSITSILRRYPAFWRLGIKWDTAGKSGTTDNFIDAWYTAYTPGWVISTWVGHTSGTNPAEVGMNEVYGTTEAQYVAVPFINSLPKPEPFPPASGQVAQCTGATFATVTQGACATATPSLPPTPLSTPTPSPSTATPSASPSPTCSVPEPLQTLGPCATPSASPSSTPSGGAAAAASPQT